jgi:hypothetical protein
MERHDDFPSARNQAASSQRSPNGKQNFLNNSRSVTSVGNSGRQLGSVFPRFRASIWRSCGQNACRDLLNQSAGSYWTTDATYCTGYVGPAKNNVEFFHFHTISKAGVNFHVFHDFHASGCEFRVFAFTAWLFMIFTLQDVILHVFHAFHAFHGPRREFSRFL